MRVEVVHVIRGPALGWKPWQLWALSGGRALVWGATLANERKRSFGLVEAGEARPIALPDGAVVTDGERVVVLEAGRLHVTSSPLDAKPKIYELPVLKKGKEDVSVLSTTLAPEEDAVWAVASDTFAIAQGRFVAKLTWKGSAATWSALKQPFAWSPYSHAGVFLEAVGGASADTTFLSTFSEASAALARVGKNAHSGVSIERGLVAFGTQPASFLVLSKKTRRFTFHDAKGNVAASFTFGASLKAALKSAATIASLAVNGRDLWIASHDGSLVHARLSEDPPALGLRDAPPAPAKAATPKKKSLAQPKGPYGAFDPSAMKSAQLVIAAERVRAWDLNETPDFAKPAPFALLVLGNGWLGFYRQRNGKLRKSFDFMARAVTVSTVPAPKAAHAPSGVVLAQLRTPSGLTQVLCRKDFASILAANTKKPKKK
jgi:hypothetical protein